MTELLEYGPDSPHIVIDDDGEIHDPADFPEFDLDSEKPSYQIEDTPAEARHDKKVISRRNPKSVEEHKRRINSTQMGHTALDTAMPRTERELTAQEELGGGIDQTDEYQEHVPLVSHPLDEIIRESQPWQEEVYEVVERFGMNELTFAQYKAMNMYDRLKFAVNFSRFYDLLKAQPRAIEIFEGKVENRPDILGKYGKNRTPEELYSYKETLEKMIGIVQATGIPEHAATDRDTLINKARSQGRGKRAINNLLRPNYHDYKLTIKTVK